MDLALVLFCESQMSTQMTDILEFFEAWITLGRVAKMMSWNISILDSASSTWVLLMGLEELLLK